ncbi:hypothetical protein [Sphingobacterium sp. DR205]|uniref:hypothetical protein n=1 Tax=Sphingobacterium sp. DR205 TaxID=2713573 RepID=UPI0013E45A6E|nr:hypothetical protein [Sphingobacterium sp. DR205]QIH32922.1 hypothetical protein G6053_08465 [Sphingobacterium sp. DR205]
MAVLEQQWEGVIEQSFKPTKVDRQRQFQRILSSISSAKKTHTAITKTRTSLWGSTWTRIAACIAFCAFATLLYFLLQPKADPSDPVRLSDNNLLVLPDKQTAQILFDDGTVPNFPSIKPGTVKLRIISIGIRMNQAKEVAVRDNSPLSVDSTVRSADERDGRGG